MLDVLTLLVFGKLQEHVYEETSRAWQWALAYTLFVLSGQLFGGNGNLLALLIGAVLVFLYAWAYFGLLRYFVDSLMVWLLVYIGGALLPLLIALKLIAAAQP